MFRCHLVQERYFLFYLQASPGERMPAEFLARSLQRIVPSTCGGRKVPPFM